LVRLADATALLAHLAMTGLVTSTVSLTIDPAHRNAVTIEPRHAPRAATDNEHPAGTHPRDELLRDREHNPAAARRFGASRAASNA
jgi:hypothetical protein